MKYAILLLGGLAVGCSCDSVKPTWNCYESVCHPSWSGDCYCYNGARVEPLPNGDVMCKCSK